MAEQTFANHMRWVPAFHFFVMPVLTLNFGWAIYRWKAGEFSLGGFVDVLTALAILVAAFLARVFALKVQDRVIRLEERLRLERLLPADLKERIGEFTCGQLVGLRFASDAELPELARKVLTENIRQSRAIKQMVNQWRADELRA